MERLFEHTRGLVNSSVPLLFKGERGTGRKSLALILHNLGLHKDKPFMVFAHDYGDNARQKGIKAILKTHPGTLYIEEIADLGAPDQFDLYWFLKDAPKDESFTRVIGSTRSESLVEEKKFRNDLYYSFIGLCFPPLRDRHDDISLLAQFFLKRCSDEKQQNVPVITPQATLCLSQHSWPGNVAELENRIKKAFLLAHNEKITPEDLDLSEYGGKKPANSDFADAAIESGVISVPIGLPLEKIEKIIIEKTLEHCRGDKNMASKMLGISARTLYRKVEEKDQIEEGKWKKNTT
jgi:DNA-binding NtrC family response regulator